MQDHESQVTEVDSIIATVADFAYEYVIDAYNDFMAENELDPEAFEDVDFDLYLYVYGNGTWIIDNPSYLQDHRDIVAYAAVCNYQNVDTLRYELEASTF